jgi:hypothetical protein
MVTLKEVFATIKIAEEEYRKCPDVCGTIIDREIKLRTKLARAIARDNPPLNPNKEEDLSRGVVDLPKSTVLSPIAFAIFKKYCLHLLIGFQLNPGPYISFKDLCKIYAGLHARKVSFGSERSWRTKELRVFNLLCTHIGNLNNMSVTEIMLEFEEGNDIELTINEAAINLALSLFREMKA